MTFTAERNDGVLLLGGTLELRDRGALWRRVRSELDRDAAGLRVDLTAVDRIDGASAAMLHSLRNEAVARGAKVEFDGARGEVQRLLDMYACPPGRLCLKTPPRRIGVLDQIGRVTCSAIVTVRDVFGFIGDLCLATVRAIRSPRSLNWADICRLMEHAGADGVPIVLLINFLIGLIIALQAAPQLQQFGANVFVADMVGVSITRELGPLMTAIIVAGRSGAAYAAELGTMKVSEEVDALRTLGLDPQRYLVFPRVVALALVVPVLTLLADAVACFGGLVIAVNELGLTQLGYLNQLWRAVGFWDVFGGLLKSTVFAVTITLIACQRGLATRGGAEGVGASTTSAVVVTLFSLVLLDGVFTVVYRVVGI